MELISLEAGRERGVSLNTGVLHNCQAGPVHGAALAQNCLTLNPVNVIKIKNKSMTEATHPGFQHPELPWESSVSKNNFFFFLLESPLFLCGRVPEFR